MRQVLAAGFATLVFALHSCAELVPAEAPRGGELMLVQRIDDQQAPQRPEIPPETPRGEGKFR